MSWQDAVERTVVALGYDLVEVERGAGGLVRVTIDRTADDPRGGFVTVDDCETVTRQLQPLLDVEGAAYERLEVSSPGLDRPLRKEADYRRFAGAPVALTLKEPFEGRKRFQGRLLAPEEAEGPWRLALDETPAAPPGARNAPRRRGARSETAPAATGRALEFRIDEVREARLVPVVDFKGRRAPPSDGEGKQ